MADKWIEFWSPRLNPGYEYEMNERTGIVRRRVTGTDKPWELDTAETQRNPSMTKYRFVPPASEMRLTGDAPEWELSEQTINLLRCLCPSAFEIAGAYVVPGGLYVQYREAPNGPFIESTFALQGRRVV